MTIHVRCDCGKKLKLRDSLAGKQVRCPDCEDVLEVPEGDTTFDDLDDYEDERPRRASGNSRGRKRAPAKSSGSNSLVIVLVVGGLLAAMLFVAVVVYFITRRPNPNDVAQNPLPIQVAPGVPQPNVQPNVQPSAVPASAAPQPVINPPAAVPAVAPVPGAPGQTVWCVVSNFKKVPPEPGRLAFGETYSVDFSVASGQFDPSKKYVLYVRSPSPGGFIEHYLEVDLPPGNSGSVKFSPGPGFIGGTSPLASVAYRKGGRNEFEQVSGEASIGGQPTSATRPPTVQELAGPSAQGKLVAIANGKWSSQGAGQAFSLDFVLQSQPDGLYYFVVGKSGSGNGFEFDVTTEFRTAKQGERKTVGGRLFGRPVSGPVTVHIEKRTNPGSFRIPNQPAPEVVSNAIQVQ